MKRYFFRYLLPVGLVVVLFWFGGVWLGNAIQNVSPATASFRIRQMLEGYREVSHQVLRVAVPYKSRLFGDLSPFGPGLEMELVQQLHHETGAQIRFIDVPTLSDALELLEAEMVDLAAGFAVPEETLADPRFETGPPYYDVRATLVRARHARPAALQTVLFCDDALTGVLDEVSRAETVPDHTIFVPAEQEIFEHLSRQKASHALVDSRSLRAWQPFFTGFPTATRHLGQPAAHRWIWRTGHARMADPARAFWRNREHDELLDELEERYFGFLPRKVNEMDIATLLQTIEQKLHPYAATIARAAKKYDIDPLLLAALIFQESRFDPEARSATGVRGLMQLTTETAAALGVDRLDPIQSIEAGARYLRQLWKAQEPLGLSPWDRWFFTLAAYNQGLGHLQDAIALARSQTRARASASPLTWRALRRTYPLLTQEAVYSKTRHGFCRGYEAVDFVDKVRFYYYILSGLVMLERPQARHLLPLLRAMPQEWPAPGFTPALRLPATAAAGRLASF